MKTIELTNGKLAYVDDEDHTWLSAFRWVEDRSGYAQTNVKLPNGRWTTRKMARMVMGLDKEDSVQVDHRNLVKLDNQKSNLRLCSRSQNCQNRTESSLNTSGYKGVHFASNTGRWRAKIAVAGRRVSLGLFDTPQLAHEFYCLAADLLHGEFANHGT